MIQAPAGRLPVNPFATRFTSPGRLPPLDAAGAPLDAPRIARGLPRGRVVAVEGPHGHGKSTLLAAILAAASATGRPTGVVRIRNRRDAWRPVAAALSIGRGACLGCDGWERCPPGIATAVCCIARVRGLSVVVTTHAAAGLPVLARCGTSPRLFAELVKRLPDHRGLIDAADLDDAFARHSGNLREALYDLYDRFERRVRSDRDPARSSDR